MQLVGEGDVARAEVGGLLALALARRARLGPGPAAADADRLRAVGATAPFNDRVAVLADRLNAERVDPADVGDADGGDQPLVCGERQHDVLLDAGFPKAAGRGGVGQLQAGIQQQKQVKQVDAGIQDDAAAGACGLQLPAGRAVGMAAVTDQQVEGAQRPEGPAARGVQQLADPGQEAVVVAHEARSLDARGGFDQPVGLLAPQPQRLLHQHRAPGGQDLVGGDLGEVVGSAMTAAS